MIDIPKFDKLIGDTMPVEDNEDNINICKRFCGSCPSFPKTDEWLFCARGKSAKGIKRDGCICAGCDIFEKNNLSTMYFCDEGAAE